MKPVELTLTAGTCKICAAEDQGIYTMLYDTDAGMPGVFVCAGCVAKVCHEHTRGKQGVTARYKLIKRAEQEGVARDGNYVVYNFENAIELYYRDRFLANYSKTLDAFEFSEYNEDSPRTKALRINFRNAIALWKKDQAGA